MRYGVSYYPEHKNQRDLEQDLKHIIESGINTVRMGEFAWCRFEPKEGEFHFEWLDPVVKTFGEHGISTIICTPTACPPAWMIEKHPDILYVDNRGITRPFGGRRHYCYNNPVYREYSRRIAEEIGKHYGDNPYVAGFQIDNEPAQEGTGRCHCPVCQEKFREYLKEKYHTIEELNERSGGIFWSQDYTNFDQINIPVNTIEVGARQQIDAFYENPTIRLEFERFASDSQIEYQDIQSSVLKKYTKGFVTTNATGLATNSIDYYKSTKELDTYTFDYYPGLRNTSVDAFPYAFARGIKGGKHFGVMEFMSGGGHRFSGSGRQQPNPGALKQAVFQSFAHGADLMLHFQYRTFPFGAEQLNYAIVDMDGIPRRRYFEMQETAALLKKLSVYEEAEFENQTAILLDYDAHWALRIKPVNDPIYHYLNDAGEWFHCLEKEGIGCDVVSYDADLSKYRVVILPGAFILRKEYREKFKEYVKNGGRLIATFLTSVKNEDNVGYTESLPAGLNDLFGVTVEEVEPIFADNHANVRLTVGGKTVESEDRGWCDLLGGSAKMIGTYTDTFKEGSGIISENAYGNGKAYYIGTGISEEAMRTLLSEICKEASVNRVPFEIPEKVEVVRRTWNGKNCYYFINFTQGNVEIPVGKTYKNLVTDEAVNGSLTMEAQGFALLMEE
jgi:beta-galactosidase